MIVFDIETGPAPDAELLAMVDPFTVPPHPGEFAESSVKLGQLKDEAKIKDKIEKARAEHLAAVARYESDVATAKEEWWKGIVSKAALSPLTGRLLAIGYCSTDSGRIILDIDDETAMLHRFWLQYKKCRTNHRIMCGHNIAWFDVPFLMRRSWLVGMDVPTTVMDRGRWLDQTFVDTMSMWGAGNRDMVKLDTLAKAFGVGAKPDGVDGSMFSDLLTTDREKAEAYLTNDLRMTAGVAERMGVL